MHHMASVCKWKPIGFGNDLIITGSDRQENLLVHIKYDTPGARQQIRSYIQQYV